MKTLLRIISSALLALLTTLFNPAFAQLGSQSSDLVFTPITPCRILDSRGMGGPIYANNSQAYKAWASSFTAQGGSATDCNTLQSTDMSAVVINFTVVNPATGGYITAYPFSNGPNKPTAATVNFTAGSVVGNNATLKIGRSTQPFDFTVYTTSTLDLVADIVGYYAKPVATAIECTTVFSAVTDLLPGTSQSIYSPQCSAGYTMMSGGCYRASGSTTGNTNAYGFAITGSAHATNPLTHYCGMNNSHATETSSVQAKGLCCRIPGR